MRQFARATACAASLALSLAPGIAAACATCGCTLSTDAATGYSSQQGWRVNLEYVWLDQDQLRHGDSGASPQDVVDRPADPSADASEIERDTYNRYANLSVSWHSDADWGFSLIAPVVRRDHTTFGEYAPPFESGDVAASHISGAHVSGLGDIKLLANYQGFLPTRNFGVVAGVKLASGRYGGENEDGAFTGNPARFDSGPLRGEALDSSLQAGTGSTDAIVGAYWYQPISQDFDAFANGQFQAAIAHRMDTPGLDYRPGNQLSINLGLRYEAHANWVPQLQLNLLDKRADQGALADRTSSSGTVAYLSPGISVSLRGNVQAYGFVQLPVYSQLAGYQLFPHWAATLGVSVAL